VALRLHDSITRFLDLAGTLAPCAVRASQDDHPTMTELDIGSGGLATRASGLLALGLAVVATVVVAVLAWPAADPRARGLIAQRPSTTVLGTVEGPLGAPARGLGPIAEPEPVRRPTDADIQAARAFAKRREGDVSFAVTSTRGFVRGHRRTRVAPSASVSKALLLVAALRESDDAALPADLAALLEPMIRRSDNLAALAVQDRLGAEPLRRLADAASLQSLELNGTVFEMGVTASDLARLFVRLHELLPQRHRAFAEEQLSGIEEDQRWGLPRALPERVVMFKGGWRGSLVHQAGVVLVGQRRVGIAVLTTANPSQACGRATVEGITRRLLGDARGR